MEVAVPAAVVFAVLAAGVVAFQVALALGAPWGAYAMGGAFPGSFPPRLRIAALVQAAIMGLLGLAVLSRAGLLLPDLAGTLPWLPWVAAGVSAVAVILNAISRSAPERRIWVPVTVGMLGSSLLAVAAG